MERLIDDIVEGFVGGRSTLTPGELVEVVTGEPLNYF